MTSAHLILLRKLVEALLVPLVYNLHTVKSFSAFLFFCISHLRISPHTIFSHSSVNWHHSPRSHLLFSSLPQPLKCVPLNKSPCLPNDSALNRVFLSMAELRVLSTPLSMQRTPSEGPVTDDSESRQLSWMWILVEVETRV